MVQVINTTAAASGAFRDQGAIMRIENPFAIRKLVFGPGSFAAAFGKATLLDPKRLKSCSLI
jgi:hypothetical protein